MLDFNHTAIGQAQWNSGPPEFSKFLGFVMKGRVKVKAVPIPVRTLRCTECGFLHSFANPVE